MSHRTIYVLAGAFVALLILFTLTREEYAADTTGALLLPELSDLNDIARISLRAAGGEAVATVERDRGRWVVVQKDRYPADLQQIRDLVLVLSQARILEQKTSNPELYDRLGVEPVEAESANGAQLTLEGAEQMLSLILGDTVGSDYRYARRTDQAESYLIDRSPALPEDPVDWLVPNILSLDRSRIQEMTITHADGETVRISKQSPDDQNFSLADLPEGRELLYVGIQEQMPGVLRSLGLEDVARLQADDESDVVTEFRTFDGLIVTANARATGEDEGWVSFDARYDAGQADRFRAALGEAEAADGEAAPETAAADDGALAPTAEAAELSERLAGWQYRIPAHQYEQITRRMEDLLKAPGA